MMLRISQKLQKSGQNFDFWSLTIDQFRYFLNYSRVILENREEADLFHIFLI
jgi:hypothetical protein